uniref:Uncharacterized protein n=1 Tax=Candidatus Kentrum sp. TC TaxID=2126339 RepID=A0A450YYY7_9GAMM|nr:MAG: hypothetical protein BECKTC1821D_GA0114238_103521 [Candidatus Kentron sp. TC]
MFRSMTTVASRVPPVIPISVTMIEMRSISQFGRQVKVMPNLCQRLIIASPSLSIKVRNLDVDILALSLDTRRLIVEVRNLSVESLSLNDEVQSLSVETLNLNDASSTRSVDTPDLSVASRNLNRHPAPHSAGLSGFFFALAFFKRSPNWSATGFRPGGQSWRRSGRNYRPVSPLA